MRNFITGALAALVLLCVPAAAMAAAAGTAKGVDPAASAVAGTDTRVLVVGADINIGDLIKTGDHGQVEVLFADNTKLVVGPNSNLQIQDYLIRNNGSAGKIALDVLGGSFRFVTGTSPKPDYVINTPTGTIGVRGTAFEGFVDDQGVLHLMMFEGTSIMCGKHAKFCQELTKLCEVGQIDSSKPQIIGNANDISGEQRDLLKTYFHYVMDESSLDREFRIPHAYECLHKPPDLGLSSFPSASTGFYTPPSEGG